MFDFPYRYLNVCFCQNYDSHVTTLTAVLSDTTSVLFYCGSLQYSIVDFTTLFPKLLCKFILLVLPYTVKYGLVPTVTLCHDMTSMFTSDKRVK